MFAESRFSVQSRVQPELHGTHVNGAFVPDDPMYVASSLCIFFWPVPAVQDRPWMQSDFETQGCAKRLISV